MQRWNGLEQVPDDQPRSVVCIGVFDGVHRGHRAIISRAVEYAHTLDAPAVVITFDPHPSEVIRPGTHPGLLSTVDQRCELLEELGVDGVCVLPFTMDLAALSPQEFVDHVLVDRFHALGVVVGANFRFGNRAAGDTELLGELGLSRGFMVDAAPLVAGTGGTWSSTYVRGLVAAGDVASAGLSLGRPHRVEGLVVHGDKRGRELGFPTANLGTIEHAAIPADGVYAAWLVDDPYGDQPQRYPAAVSIGTNPTFDGVIGRRVEAYVLDRTDLDLYDHRVALDFVDRIRGQVKFEGIEPLIVQMNSDVDKTREVLGLTAGSGL